MRERKAFLVEETTQGLIVLRLNRALAQTKLPSVINMVRKAAGKADEARWAGPRVLRYQGCR